MIVLDTNVILKTIRQSSKPKSNDLAFRSKLKQLVYYNANNRGTLVMCFTSSNWQKALSTRKKITLITEKMYFNRTLILDEEPAKLSGKYVGDQFLKGLKPSIADCQIAGIVSSNKFIVATGDTKDFKHEGLKVINPWQES